MGQKKKYYTLSDLEHLIETKSVSAVRSKNRYDGKGNTVQVLLDTHGRKGKSVTIVNGLRHNPATMEEIARILKQYCGAGGTVKEGKIEVQGDQRDRVSVKLKDLNYKVVNK
jgi:predicted translation initiation factor SUI1